MLLFHFLRCILLLLLLLLLILRHLLLLLLLLFSIFSFSPSFLIFSSMPSSVVVFLFVFFFFSFCFPSSSSLSYLSSHNLYLVHLTLILPSSILFFQYPPCIFPIPIPLIFYIIPSIFISAPHHLLSLNTLILIGPSTPWALPMCPLDSVFRGASLETWSYAPDQTSTPCWKKR